MKWESLYSGPMIDLNQVKGIPPRMGMSNMIVYFIECELMTPNRIVCKISVAVLAKSERNFWVSSGVRADGHKDGPWVDN